MKRPHTKTRLTALLFAPALALPLLLAAAPAVQAVGVTVAPTAARAAETCDKVTASVYSGVQIHADNINNLLHDHGGVVTVDVAATVLVELEAINGLLTAGNAGLEGSIAAGQCSGPPAAAAVTAVVGTVNLLTTTLNTVYSAAGGDGAVVSLLTASAVQTGVQGNLYADTASQVADPSGKADLKAAAALLNTAVGYYR